MREILFRGKSLVTKEWVYGDLGKSPITKKWVYGDLFQHGEQWFIMTGGHNIEVDPESVGQFTGLKDKNGVKIFEGDIVKTYGPDDSPAEVVYDESETQYGIVIDNIYYCLGEHFRGIDLEVIGNIYDNPELIEDGE